MAFNGSYRVAVMGSQWLLSFIMAIMYVLIVTMCFQWQY